MKYLLLFFASAVIAADISVTFPPLTERQRYGLQFAVNEANSTNNPNRPTNFVWTVATYNRTNVEQVLQARVIDAREGILENYAQQRDAVETQARFDAMRRKWLNATEAQRAQIDAIISTNQPAP